MSHALGCAALFLALAREDLAALLAANGPMCRLIIGHQVPGECPGRMRFGCNCNSHARASHSRELVIRSSGVLKNLSSEPPPASEPMRALVFVLAHNQVAHCFKATCAPLNSFRDSISRSSRILTRLQPTIRSGASYLGARKNSLVQDRRHQFTYLERVRVDANDGGDPP